LLKSAILFHRSVFLGKIYFWLVEIIHVII
jgi:hypothetical protein